LNFQKFHIEITAFIINLSNVQRKRSPITHYHNLKKFRVVNSAQPGHYSNITFSIFSGQVKIPWILVRLKDSVLIRRNKQLPQ